MGPEPTFVVTLVQNVSPLKLRSTCRLCGESQIVSAADGSLQEWQDRHRCPRPEAKGIAPATPEIPGAAD